MKSILSKDFRYTNSATTDLRKTFTAWHRQYAKDWADAHAEQSARNLAEAREVVRPISRKKVRA